MNEQEQPAAPEGLTPSAEVPEAPPAEPAPIFVSQTDRLVAENVNLKLINIVNRETILQMQLNEVIKERMQRTRELEAVKMGIEHKYGFSLTDHIISEGDGKVVPRAPK